MGVNLVLSTAELGVDAGAEAVIQVRVQNTGAVVDRFRLDVVGEAAVWATVDPAEFGLFPEAERNVTVRFQPPRDPKVRAGTWPIGIRAVSEVDALGSRTEEATITLRPFIELTARIVPRRSRGRRSARHSLDVTNRGNAPANLNVEGSDPDEALTIKPRPAALDVAPGQTRRVRIRVAPRALFASGPPESHDFTVKVSTPAGESASADAAMLQSATVPRWVPRLVLLAALLAVAAVVLSQTVLKPTPTHGPATSGGSPTKSSGAATPSPTPRGPRPILFVRLYTHGTPPPNTGQGISDIFAMQADGTSPVNLTRDTGINDHPAWSPDGTHIAFQSMRSGDLAPQIYVMAADGSQATRITTPPPSEPGDSFVQPAWSPDGTRVAFAGLTAGQTSVLESEKVDGTGLTLLNSSPSNLSHPTWSPDGRHIAYSALSNRHLAIFAMNTDGTGQTRLFSDGAADEVEPAWSPDGTKIAFTKQTNGTGAIYVGSIGPGLTPGTPTNEFRVASNFAATWSANSIQLVFTTTRYGADEIIVANADASGGRTQLTRSPASTESVRPAWFTAPGPSP